MFIAALFTISRTRKRSRPLTDECKLWHIHIIEYYSATKTNKVESVPGRWMNLESVVHSEVSQKEKNKYNILTQIHGI